MGMVLGWTSPALVDMEKETSSPRITDKYQHSWIGSSMTLGALFGALISGEFRRSVFCWDLLSLIECVFSPQTTTTTAWVAQTFGRRLALIVYGIPFTVGWCCLGFAPDYTLIICGRVVVGFSAGLLSGTAPTYIKEIATVATQGILGTGFQVCAAVFYYFPKIHLTGWLMPSPRSVSPSASFSSTCLESSSTSRCCRCSAPSPPS